MTIAALNHVSMTYGAVRALDDVSLELHEGETVALLGPNGAGKTTAIGLLTGLKRVQDGEAVLFGRNPQIPKAREWIGVTPQEAAYPQAWKVGEILRFARSHYTEPADMSELVEAFELSGALDRDAARMSGGQQRKLAVALAFSGAPRAVFLDEPTTGLDIESRKQVWRYVAQFKAAGGAVFLTTHHLDEADALADRIILLNKGVVVRSGTVEQVKAVVDVRIVRFDAASAPALRSARLQSSSGTRYTYRTANADLAVRELVETDVAFSSLEVLPSSLDDAVSALLRSDK